MSLNDRELSPQVIADWIISHNLHRRHLTTSQKAMVGQGYLAYLKEEAKKRQIEAVKRGNVSRHSDSPIPANLPELGKDRSKESAEQAARIVGASARSIKDADFVVKNDPELAQQVRDSKVTVSAAAKRIREALNPKPKQTPEQVAEKLAKAVAKHDEEVIRLTVRILNEILGENG